MRRTVSIVAGLIAGACWTIVVLTILINTPASGTDANRFEGSLRALREEVFFWHESMYMTPDGTSKTWVPHWDWYMTISHEIEKFQAELQRLPNSACAAEARGAVITDGPWVSATVGDMPGVEAKWKNVIEHLPLSCEEF